MLGREGIHRAKPRCLLPATQEEIARWGQVWALCVRSYVGRLPGVPPRVDELLSPEEAAELRAAAKARHFALQRLRSLVVEARRGLCHAEVRPADVCEQEAAVACAAPVEDGAGGRGRPALPSPLPAGH